MMVEIIAVIAFIATMFLEAYHDFWHDTRVWQSGQYYWKEARIGKLFKFLGLLLATSILVLIGNWNLFIFYWILRFFLFDFIYNFISGRPMNLKYIVKHHELYYWYQMIRGKK